MKPLIILEMVRDEEEERRKSKSTEAVYPLRSFLHNAGLLSVLSIEKHLIHFATGTKSCE